MMASAAIPAPASRNSPCPCGSGQRYKNCHGALAADASAPSNAAAVRRLSSYQAPLGEWPEMSEEERDRLGAIMERALAHQLASRVEDAERDYRTVLERAPDAHDALHMLGVIELGRDNLEEAERLIRRAMGLRSPYPTIARNLQLVEDAKLTHLRESPELLCERALPIFADLALGATGDGRRAGPSLDTPSTASSEIHLIGRVRAPLHNDGWLLNRLAQLIDGNLWALDAAGVGRLGDRAWRGIDAGAGDFPRAGTHIMVGIDTENLDWLDRAAPARVIVFCSGVAPSACLDQLRRIARDGARNIELVFFSAAEAARFGSGHRVLVPPIEVPPPRPRAAPDLSPSGVQGGEKAVAFRVGIVGQSCLAVGDAETAEALESLRQCADELAIYDPGPLRFLLRGARNVCCVPRTPGGLVPFLSGLDALVMRPRIWYYENGMHEFFGARALGLPVLCPENSRWAEYVDDRVDGLRYRAHEDMLRLLVELRSATQWAHDLGTAARTRTLDVLDAGGLRRQYAGLVGGTGNERVPAGAASTPAERR